MTPLLERGLEELLVLLSVASWVMLRVSGAVQKVISERKQLSVVIGRKEVIHINGRGGNLSLEVLPTEKSTLKAKENKDNLEQQEKDKILLTEGLGTQAEINLTLSKQTEKLDSYQKKACISHANAKEVNIEKWH
jgi:hypothetical protein